MAASAPACVATIPLQRVHAVIFDTDGVITDTAAVHAAAWKRTFDTFLHAHTLLTGQRYEPFDPDVDYRRYVDGKPRFAGVVDFLAARGITLPPGDPADPPGLGTAHALGNRKDRLFAEHPARYGAAAWPGTIRLVQRLRAHGVRVAAVSASRHAKEVLRAAGVLELFDVVVDGVDCARLGLPGKPDPALFLEAAHRLGVPPAQAAVVEDALAGVAAGRRGGFALVIGVDRTGHAAELYANGADVVVPDLGEVVVTEQG
ncbi:HAD family hydrolase [Carbonactinospora thermoautotrophica]|uniref:HAD family hydrolase n=1 Tax=Carbonactinospora thermoautotrophica TaxID=1469144 RepID=UPI003DA95A7C